MILTAFQSYGLQPGPLLFSASGPLRRDHDHAVVVVALALIGSFALALLRRRSSRA